MQAGTVLSFNPDKHYGFIKPDDGAEHVMLHERDLCSGAQVSRIREGVRVSYDVRRTQRGLRASNIRVQADSQSAGAEPVVLTEEEFRDEVTVVLAEAYDKLSALARRCGWVK